MDKETVSVLIAVVANKVKDGYRRAGLSFSKGENKVEVTESQLIAIKNDPRLVVLSAESAEVVQTLKNKTKTGPIDEKTGPLVDDVQPESMTVEQLKNILTERGISFKSSDTKAVLVDLVKNSENKE